MLVPNSSNTAGFRDGDVKPCISIVILCLLCALRFYEKQTHWTLFWCIIYYNPFILSWAMSDNMVKNTDKVIKMFIPLQPIKIKSFFYCKINVRTGFLDPENMDKDTKIDFLSQVLRKLWGIEYLARLAQADIFFFGYMTVKFSRVLEWHFSDSRSYDVSSKWCQVWYVKWIQIVCFILVSANSESWSGVQSDPTR